ncbi:DUF4489 domain-containing protein [Bacillus taeanensis]|uniref:DUF4489 domain-containing protein n=1 Tax=Bacillus taeanensis TaxID=273032 RepID=A0A366XT30_9BACI|nr:DUF4489 domain-containing protein [Bacillus taeanensis]RBW67899.1 hypothetical protein DS031_19670 [Bacillus taeanensis]
MQTIPFLNCGKVFKVNLPKKLMNNDPPINLAAVKVNPRNIEMPCVLFNYSQILEFEIFGLNPSLSIVYRLVRKSNHTGKIKVLEKWTYKASEIFPTVVQNIKSIEPLVLNFCDCLDDRSNKSFTYIVQIEEIIVNNATFNITNQEISAIVSCGESE